MPQPDNLEQTFERLLEKASLAAATSRAFRDALRESFRSYQELRLEPAEFVAAERKPELLPL